MTPLEKLRSRLAELSRFLTRPGVGASFFFSLLGVCLLYRGMLCYTLYTDPAIPPSYSKHVPALYFWRYFRNDLAVSLLALGVVGFVSLLLTQCAKRLRRPLGFVCLAINHLLALAILMALAMVMLVHYHLLFEVNSGLSTALFMEGLHQLGPGNFVAMMPTRDLLFLLSPLLVFHAFHLLRARFNKGAAACCGAGLVVVLGLQFQSRRTDVDWSIMQNPVQYFALDLVQAVKSGRFSQASSPYVDKVKAPGAAQMSSLKLIDPLFVTPGISKQPPPMLRSAPNGKWNVLFVVMESTGGDYIFDAAAGGEVPMPFLHRLSKAGLTLANHYSTSNYSPKSAFSLFTGLYCRPDPYEFSTLAHTCVPTYNTFVGPDYQCFHITPASTTFFFPLALLINNGMREIYDVDSVPVRKRPQITPNILHESDSVDFLLQKLDATTGPFFAVYWSFLPHWPYADYGERYRFAHSANAKQDLYYNNLRALDTELKRIYDHLEATGKLQNTILVFVGDHGEGFGRHSNAMMHGIGTFDETYKAPAIFYQPALFAPRQVTQRTSHVDVLPTLLDAMGIKYNPELVQGESLLRGDLERKYIFMVSGSSDFITSIDQAGVKVSLSMVAAEGYAYDLSQDPWETKRLSLDAFPGQVDATVKFRTFQYETLGRYNQCLWEKRRWEDEGKEPAVKK